MASDGVGWRLSSGTDLDVREDARKGTVIAGAVEVAVSSLQELMELMNRGSLYRTTEATNCNEVSSRSHAVLQITCSGVEKYLDGTGPTKKQLSKLSMIDLAGSERAYKTDNTGQRLREGRNINRSLLSLANCINALADRTKKSTSHVPYRDSKLTRLLRDSLSGTSVSVMLCAVSPASDQFEETLNTLKYANRAKSMSPPQMPQRQVQEYNPVAEQVEVLKELKESLIPIMTKMTASPSAGPAPDTTPSAAASAAAGRAEAARLRHQQRVATGHAKREEKRRESVGIGQQPWPPTTAPVGREDRRATGGAVVGGAVVGGRAPLRGPVSYTHLTLPTKRIV